jgi:RNA polymerase sigma-70 factor, ECF subfamily
VTDPLANPGQLIKRVYAYAAYRLGDGPDAEDATSETFARALRYRSTYDRSKGAPTAWLIGIAKRSVDDVLAGRPHYADEQAETAAPGDLEEDMFRRIEVRAAVATLDERSRELIALRYGADLTARQIAELIGERTNTVEVALHRALERLRAVLKGQEGGGGAVPIGAEEPLPASSKPAGRP